MNPTNAECNCAHYGLFGGFLQALIFGQPLNWSLEHNRDEAVMNIAEIASVIGARSVRAVRPNFSAELREYGKRVYTFDSCLGVGISIEKECDAIEIEKDQVFFIDSADCPTLVVWDVKTGRVICVHAGRDCLWDRHAVLYGASPRENASVVSTVVKHLNADPKNLRAFIFGGISASNFLHPASDPERGFQNERMIAHFTLECGHGLNTGDYEFGGLCLKSIIRHQLMKHGLKSDQIGFDNIDTFGDVGSDGKPLWWSYRRGGLTERHNRNGVFVLRTPQ